MTENRARSLALALMALVLLGGCGAGRTRASFHHASGPRQSAFASEGTGETPPSSWPELSTSDAEELLAPFLSCTSPAEFVARQREVDMARLVERLDDWSAIRLGALGPLPARAAEVLNRKRASFLVTATREYGVAPAEVFALFVIHSAFDEDLRQVLRRLAEDRPSSRATCCWAWWTS